ncbi:reactive intermediate/imine deaminase [Pedobacter yulinensis]|uniref:Reactive intermediate/imine deaminase n=1 Tax=Pedobacter yulinensis TaxID=2126353 RepID=A0A2T3HQZ7_9SPHI|nr:RidA family protein [Pedobacter yulinensis]PST84868.1 reactive intermediate/imine deaminase [Pedobacter yulinensis]
MKKVIQTKNAPAPIGPYSQAVQTGNLLFVSGQIAINPETEELNLASIEEETHQVMRNIKAILLEAEITFAHVIKTSIFLSDMNNFAKVNEVYGSYFTADFPARETVQVSVLPKNVNVEISVIAAIA